MIKTLRRLSRYALAFPVLFGALSGSAQLLTRPPPILAPEWPVPPAVTIPAGLAAARERVVRELRKNLGDSADITFARDSRAVMLLRLPSKSGDREPNTETAARAFLERFQRFLDPSIDPLEYQLSGDERGYDGKVVVFDRVVDGLRVVGSKMTLRFDRDGALREVVNGVASSPATILP